MIHPNILSLIGATPVVYLNRVFPHSRIRLATKLEAQNVGGSIKDRVALAMIEAAEASGELTPDKTVIEATSGNTGVGLAMVCAVKGYKLTLLMPDSASEERKRIMRAYGAELRLTPGTSGVESLVWALPIAAALTAVIGLSVAFRRWKSIEDRLAGVAGVDPCALGLQGAFRRRPGEGADRGVGQLPRRPGNPW